MKLTKTGLAVLAAVIICACQKEQPISDVNATKPVAEKLKAVTIPYNSNTEPSAQLPESPVAHLCRTGENVYLTARMKNANASPEDGTAYKLEATPKLVSLCLRMDNSALIYRYGTTNTIELENMATQEKPFKNFQKQTGRVHENYFSFSRDNYHYFVIESGGMGRGVSLHIYEGNTKIVTQFSGLIMDEDFHQTYISIPDNLLINSGSPMTHNE